MFLNKYLDESGSEAIEDLCDLKHKINHDDGGAIGILFI